LIEFKKVSSWQRVFHRKGWLGDECPGEASNAVRCGKAAPRAQQSCKSNLANAASALSDAGVSVGFVCGDGADAMS